MRPFRTSDAAHGIVGTYPPADTVLRCANKLSVSESFAFVRLWVSEGIPAAFQNQPFVYESVRDWLSARLSKFDVDPKAITLVGSARLGYSMSPDSFGRPFSDSSDLDFAVISGPLFAGLAATFHEWEGDYYRGVVLPQNRRQERFWKINIDLLPNMIYRGFVDEAKIPTLLRYPTSQQLRQTMALLVQRLASTPGSPRIKYASVRAYRDWKSFVSQLQINFRAGAGKFPINTAAG